LQLKKEKAIARFEELRKEKEREKSDWAGQKIKKLGSLLKHC
jgi:hypothetical protein